MGSVRFGAPKPLVLWLRDLCKIGTFVETGTNRAETAAWASGQFEQVYTVEAYEPLHQQAVEKYGDRKNIHFLKGDSREHIRSLIHQLQDPAIFWLDAHWCGEFTFGKADECPVIGEVELLNSCPVPHIVLIDDARLFLAPPPAPHQADHWPDIATVCRLLTDYRTPRYVVVHEDVIIAVPATARNQLVDFVRAEVLSNAAAPPESAPAGKASLRRVGSRIKRLFKH